MYACLLVCVRVCVCVQVRVMDLEAELRQSKPEAQMLPGRYMAGSDMLFSCKALGEFKKSFCWTVNDIHTYKVR